MGVHFHEVDSMGIYINGKIKAESSSELFFPTESLRISLNSLDYERDEIASNKISE
jgi:hypothetical protein